MTDLSTIKWFLVCKLGENNQIIIIQRENVKTDAIAYMRDNDDGTLIVLEALA